MTIAKAAVTPMMAQFLEIKAAYPDALLFYRMGDFYELFFDDAVSAAAALDIALTKRGKHLGDDIPMCGVPVHAAESYLLTLIRKGFRVAVCEQLEDPSEAKKRGAKAVVKRGVVRLVTPGTLTEDALLDARRNNFLLALSEIRDEIAIAWVDISTGEFRLKSLVPSQISPELARLAPREVLVSMSKEDRFDEIAMDLGLQITPLAGSSFDSQAAEQSVCDAFKVASLEAFGAFSRVEVSAMGALIDYLDLTQKGRLPALYPPRKESAASIVQIDAATRRNLELSEALSGGREGTLLQTVDRTVTAFGGRLMRRRIASPSADLSVIEERHDAIEHLVQCADKRESVRGLLSKCPDIERALSRLSLERGGPRDLAAVRDAIAQATALHDILSISTPLLKEAAHRLDGLQELGDRLADALIAEPPLLARDGGFIASEYDADLDEARQLRDEGRGIIATYQARYAEESGVSSLKIKHNNVLGYFIETPATHAQKMLSEPMSATFIHRQTTANAVRFTTVELSELETRIATAGGRAVEIEKRIFIELCGSVMGMAAELGGAARALAEIDVAASFAEIATHQAWVRPNVDMSKDFEIVAGRHPVVEASLRKSTGTPFIANDCDLSSTEGGALWLLTGPNMAGKSTFLRQNALIALLAQCGSFVPAKSAKIGLVSQIFSRVGAADDLARGRSTFMVEMVETAAILNQADERALVILDEIGRGTATYDGLSIAWATLEYLHETSRCRGLFATHYHEMTQLADTLDGVSNATVAVKEWDGDVIFLHEVRKGAADRSYGVQVARLAGLPQVVVDRAKVVLDALEEGDRTGEGARKAVIDDLPLFSAVPSRPRAIEDGPDALSTALGDLNPDNMTPMEALTALYELKGLASKTRS